MIRAVIASVTPPGAVDTLSVFTLEVVDSAAHLGLYRQPPHAVLRPLVGAVGAVRVSVAAPLGRHAHRVVALEGTRAAGGFGAGGLVRVVRTVAVAVADEGGGHTLAVGALKLVRGALFGRCGEAGRGEERKSCDFKARGGSGLTFTLKTTQHACHGATPSSRLAAALRYRGNHRGR